MLTLEEGTDTIDQSNRYDGPNRRVGTTLLRRVHPIPGRIFFIFHRNPRTTLTVFHRLSSCCIQWYSQITQNLAHIQCHYCCVHVELSYVGNCERKRPWLVIRMSPLQVSGRVRVTRSMRFDHFWDICIKGTGTPDVRAYFKTTFR